MKELVFIGQDIEKEKMIAQLEQCLLQDHEQDLFDEHIPFRDPSQKKFNTSI
ncbi:MAG: GTP-binding protein [Flavobacteriales bacterium]|nr:GTP-binding protein [Flavobacteriales bacterium]